MPEFYTWAILITNQLDKIGENQLSVFGFTGGQNSTLMHVPLWLSDAHWWAVPYKAGIQFGVGHLT